MITRKELEIAFIKLKSHYFYYYNSFYLKEKIIQFENSLKKNEMLFDNLADELNKEIHENSYFAQEVDFILYPKKDSFANFNAYNSLSLHDINFFIDMDIKYYLVDVIFTLELFEKIDDKVNLTCYAGRKDTRLNRENNYLFSNYRYKYKQWKNIVYEPTSSSEITAIKLDIKSFFYKAIFDFDEILTLLDLENSTSARIMKQIYISYTRKVSFYKSLSCIETNCCLPVGLCSSMVLSNFLLSDIDEQISSSVNNYGRYVDDIIIVLEGYYRYDISTLLLQKWNNLFSCKENILYLKSRYLKNELEINTNKSKIKFFNSESSKCNWRLFFENTSLIDYDDDDRNNSPNDAFEDRTIKEVRKILRQLNFGGVEDKNKSLTFLKNLESNELLNIFPVWFELLKINDMSNIFEERIKDSIDRIIIIDCEPMINKFKSDLFNELITIKKYLWSCAELSNYMLNVSFDVVQKYICSFINQKAYKYFPCSISIADISHFYSFKHVENPKVNIILKTVDLYKNINKIENLTNYDINSFNMCKKENGYALHLEDGYRMSPVKIALIALNMEDLTINDNGINIPEQYSLFDILSFIDGATKENAKYILLPEFALHQSWIPFIIKKCRNNCISLIAGLRHIEDFTKDGEAVTKNITMIYESNSGLVLYKLKNYYSPTELEIITNKHRKPLKPKKPYYFFIQDGYLSYTVATCFEITNIKDRASFSNMVNTIFLPVYNKDTKYFASIIHSLSRDISCFVAQANSSVMGDTRITQPTSSKTCDIINISGGDNNYMVVGTIKPNLLYELNSDYLNVCGKIGYSAHLDKTKNLPEKDRFKPLSAGDFHFDNN